MQSVFLLSVTNKSFMLSAIMQNVVMLIVVMLNVVAPLQELIANVIKLFTAVIYES